MRSCGWQCLPSVKAKADLVVADHGAGVVELAHLLTSTDLRSLESSVPRSQPTAGVKENSSRVRLSPFETMLITGSSGAGKSTVVTALRVPRERSRSARS